MSRPSSQRGATMIEVLIAMLIVAFGVLGYVGLQASTAVSNLEAYQRSQALVLLNDITQRLNTNRKQAASYVASNIGEEAPADCTTLAAGAEKDLCEWAELIRGSAEQKDGDSVGAVIGALGCIEAQGTDQYLVSVVWQGLRPGGPSALACGQNAYGESNENLRRGVSLVVRIANLGALPASGGGGAGEEEGSGESSENLSPVETPDPVAPSGG